MLQHRKIRIVHLDDSASIPGGFGPSSIFLVHRGISNPSCKVPEPRTLAADLDLKLVQMFGLEARGLEAVTGRRYEAHLC
jgi:hypothetical protein